MSSGWESIAGKIAVTPVDLGGHVTVHSALKTVQYVCPHCLTSLWVDTEPVDGRDWTDFSIAG